MKHMNCHIVPAVLLFGLLFPLSAASNFSGSAGVKSAVQSDTNSNYLDPAMTVQAFFSGQFDFSKHIILRTGFSLATEDLLENGIFEDINAKFKIDELSLTAQFLVGNFSNYLGFYAGTYEPVGTDVFLRRYFGIEPIDSMITTSWQGVKKTAALPLYGIGGSYIIKLNIAPVAAGTFIYVNHEDTTKDELNGDLRFACVFSNFCLDMAGGAGIPLKSENSSGDETFLTVDEVYLHGGLEMLIGNSYRGGIFTSAGIKNVKATKVDGGSLDYSAKNIYLLVEPRLVFNRAKLHIGFFSFPQETADALLFIDDSLGINATFYTDSIHVKNNIIEAGTHLTYSWPGKNISDIQSIMDGNSDGEDPNFTVSPFVNVIMPSGTLQALLQVITTEFSKKWESAVKLSLGYKTYF